jgi:Zn-dependent protease
MGKKDNSILGKMGYTIPLGKIMKIPMKLHWSIFIFLLYIPFLGWYKNLSFQDIAILFIAIIFVLGSVLLHELGHSYAARKLGIKTYDIVLSIIGGVARLEKIPEDPAEEFKVAIAGPLVNLFIFSVLCIILFITFVSGAIDVMPTIQNFINPKIFLNRFDLPFLVLFTYIIAAANFLLFAINLLPVFPMDGGRIFRAIMSGKWGRPKATLFAAYTGKFIALVLVAVGIILIQPIWSLTGVIVFFMVEIEHRQELENTRYKNIKADALLSTSYDRVKLVLPMQEVINRHFENDISMFLVEDSKSKVVGVIDDNILKTAMRENGEEVAISHYMSQRFALINIKDDYHSIYRALVTEDKSIGVVMDYGEVKGVIERDLFKSKEF